ncbi:hypothetical protein HYH02_001459 [Chlamydomonas schloesseri]|uniref:N-acetyltransferase domain-containing protein n=1 Tax=Chlamydomonas schloesseri TaxID=2026947 RepID=A0A835WY40_9CHLO|nr:hypothetical protein HYH02_001459 [Chlamydomonas schloesseri]|eukprot:KAG2454440.1 hypothetical protein HYH02_001459 [Chlamydomonas schloesseri]
MADESLSSSVTTLGATVFFAPVQPEQLDRIHALEEASYPADEAATYEKLKFRIENASNVFLVALSAPEGAGEPQVVGFVCGTQTRAPKLTHESMSTHDADGSLLCIHSVVVDPALRRRGLATRMLRAYTPYVCATTPHLTGIRLLSKQDLVPLYEAAGFKVLGPSDVVHGADVWYECALELNGGGSGEGPEGQGEEQAADC